MTDAEIERIIAEQVMGWVQDTYGPDYPADRYWFRPADRAISLICEGLVREWHPLTDPAQALRALETFCDKTGYACRLDYDLSWCTRIFDANKVWRRFDAAFGRAVCLVLVEAVKA